MSSLSTAHLIFYLSLTHFVMPTPASNARQLAKPASRGKGSFTSAQAKMAPTTKTPPIHPSSIFFSGILTLGHAHQGDGRTKVFDADFYVGADNCHAMTGVLFFYDKNNEYGQLGYDDLYFYNVWGRVPSSLNCDCYAFPTDAPIFYTDCAL